MARRGMTVRELLTVAVAIVGVAAAMWPLFRPAWERRCERLGQELLEAAESGDEHEVRRLLARWADVQARNGVGDTALHLAAREGHRRVAKLLLGRGGNPNALGEYGNAPLVWAAAHGHLDVAELLLSRGARLTESCGASLLHGAAETGHVQMVEHLLALGVDVDAVAPYVDGPTALWMAVQCRQKGVAEVLLARGADVNAARSNGWTVLHCAAAWGDQGIVRLLLDNGADLKALAAGRDSPVHLAAECGNEDVARLMLKRGAEWDPRIAAQLGDVTRLREFLDGGVDVNATCATGATLLYRAAQGGHPEAVRFLLEQGARLDLTERDYYGRNLVSVALYHGHKDVAYLLMSEARRRAGKAQ